MSTVTLTKIRSTVTTVQVRDGRETYASDAGWETSDGYVVHRTTTLLRYFDVPVQADDATRQGVMYWVRNLRGHWSQHDTLADVRDCIQVEREKER